MFDLHGNTGIHIERLTDRAEFSLASYLTPNVDTTETTRGNYQASVVLVAPEMFPYGSMSLPEGKFTVHVKITADPDGTEENPEEERVLEEDIELELHAALVVLIHSFGKKATVENSFSHNGNGILPVLERENSACISAITAV